MTSISLCYDLMELNVIFKMKEKLMDKIEADNLSSKEIEDTKKQIERLNVGDLTLQGICWLPPNPSV